MARSPSPEYHYVGHDRHIPFPAEARDDLQPDGADPQIEPHSGRPSDSDLYRHSPLTEQRPNCFADWLPHTFGHLYLGGLSTLALVLCLVIICLLWRSETNYGLGRDHGTAAVLFGWRFSPTLVAVIYIQFTAMLFEDVKRTEPYARLARPGGSAASPSILQSPGVWWNALRDGFSKKKNGGKSRSWILICAALVNILGFLVISPLSSALLTSEDVAVPHSREFARLMPHFNSPLPLDTDRTTRFRTISHALQNVSTSPWVTDSFTMLPVWPADWPTVPLGSLSSTSSQSWQVETTIFRSNLTCDKMSLEHTSGYDNKTDITVLWSSPAGCTYQLHVEGGYTMFNAGGGSWSNASTFIYTNYLPYVNSGSDFYQVNNTGDCGGYEILVLSEPGAKKSQTIYSAHLCTTKYYMANVTASVDLSSNEPSISFDESEYHQKKVLIPDSLLNTTQLQQLALNSYWASYMLSMLSQNDMPILGGPAILLGASYGFNMTDLIHDPNMIQRAGEVKQRFFGEALQASVTHHGASGKAPINGQITAFEKRVVVVKGPAVALAVLLFLSFCFLLVVWRCSRLRQRPLNLKDDPATTAEVASLVTHDTKIRSAFNSLSVTPAKEMERFLQGRHYQTEPKILSEVYPDHSEFNGTSPEVKSDSTRSSTWIPGVLRLATLLGLVISLAAVIVGIAVLYHFAEGSRLYQKFFVYQPNISIFNKTVPTVAPFSIIPTLIAVGIGLWWSAIDDNFRRLQPFLAMANGRPTFSRGINLSYQSTYWVWAAFKSARNRHWLLFMVTLGATLTPICRNCTSFCLLVSILMSLLVTTSMSALFERESGNIGQTLTLQRGLEIRRIPFLFETRQSVINDKPDEYAARIVGDLFQNLSTHWMYTASNQLILDGSQPAWSKDGWSFVPLDLRNATTSLSSVGKNDSASSALGRNLNQHSATHASPFNVSFITPAIRGRIECSSYGAEDFLNLSSWLSPWKLGPNDTVVPEGVSGLELGARWGNNRDFPSMFFPPEPGRNWTNCERCTSLYVNPSQIICCGNSSSSPSTVAVGYWSPNGSPYTWTPRTWQHNFTAKWFTGSATPVTLTRGFSDPMQRLVFSQPPNTVVLNCMPLVESANARVTVNPSTGDIQAFDILDEPEILDDAFSDNFLIHNGTHRDPDDLGYLVFNATLRLDIFMPQVRYSMVLV